MSTLSVHRLENVQDFDMANTPFVTAFNAANGAYAATNAAFLASNTSFAVTNTAYNFANTVNTFAYGVAVNSAAAFAAANNVGPQIAPTYNNANAAFRHANAAFDSANNVAPQVTPAYTTANLAYNNSNTGYASINSNWTVTNTVYGVANAAFGLANTKFSSSGGTISGAVEITADLTVHGNTRFVDQQTLQVGDPLIYLAANNYASDVVDIGFVANYVNSTSSNVHTGLFRSSGTKEYYLFQGYDREPLNNYIDPTGNNITMAILNSTVRTSNLILGGANTINWIGAAYASINSNWTVTNTIYGQVNTNATTLTSAYVVANTSYASINSNWTVTNTVYGVANTALQNTTTVLNGSLTLAGSGNLYTANGGSNMAVGTHPTYSSSYGAVWKSGYDYSLITDGFHTYLNAPNSSGAIYFRKNNNDTCVIDGSGKLGIGTTSPSVSLDLSAKTDAVLLPSGTTAQRPTGTNGLLRYNSSTSSTEIYQYGTWNTISTVYSIEYLIVAGGGAGGGEYVGGGGGAGGYLSGSTSLASGSQNSIVIGAGATGVATVQVAASGSNSTALGLTAYGGGGGGVGNRGTAVAQAASGGSGGGSGAYGSPTNLYGSGTSGQGNRGGSAWDGVNQFTSAGGGGGAGGVGGNAGTSAPSSTQGGAGGVGLQWSNGTYYAGGGGGGTDNGAAGWSGLGGTGGTGGGGNGGSFTVYTAATNGSTNTGGGGGGSTRTATTGGSGGSGIVIIRYLGSQRGSGGTVTSSGGYTYHTFTTSGTFTA